MMKMHKGSIYPSDEKPKGRIEKKQSIFGKIKPMLAVEIGKVKIKCLSELNGIAENRTVTFGTGVKGLDARYIFISAKLKLITWLEAVLISAPADEMEADSEAQIEAKRKLSNHAVQNLKGWRKINGDKSADLKAYARAPIEYIIKIYSRVKFKALAATGRIARFFKVTVFERLSRACDALAVLIHSRYNSFIATHEATANNAEAVETETDSVILQEETANAISAVGAASSIQSEQKTALKAKMALWIFPEYENGALTFYRINSAIQSRNTVEIDCEDERLYYANASNKNGVLSLVFADAEQTNNDLVVT